jgi:hypothetical protein
MRYMPTLREGMPPDVGVAGGLDNPGAAII